PEHNYFSRPFPKASVFGATFRSPEHPRRTIVVWSGEENNTSITGAVYDFTFQQPTNDSILGSRIATSREKELLSTYIRLQEAYAKEIAKIAEHEFTQMQARSKAFSLDSLAKGYSLDSPTRGYSLESLTKGYSISDLTKGYSARNLHKQTSGAVFKTFNRLSKLVRTDPEQAEDAALSILLLCKEDGKKLDGKERDLLGKLLTALIDDVAASETIPNPAAIHHYLSVAKVYL
ncbi:MAG: hypothetical protein HUK02_00760, partial [Bacteroidaceae bacterium]|nr:hypothetical protein [Bacteroidaceae bacterium]